MKLVKSSATILDNIDGNEVINKIANIARTCYKSEDKATDESNRDLVKRLIESKHEAMIEHYSVSVKFICSRIQSQSIVRHRLASFAQESQRYCNYAKSKFGEELTFITPTWYDSKDSVTKRIYTDQLKRSEMTYLSLIWKGWKPQEARDVLPNSVKTEINMTANLREWRHFFTLRCDFAAHPDIRALAIDLLRQFHNLIPIIFDDLYEKWCTNEV